MSATEQIIPDFYAINRFIRNRVGPCQHENLLIVWYSSNENRYAERVEMNKADHGYCIGCGMRIPAPPVALPWPGPKEWKPLAKPLIKDRQKRWARYLFSLAKRRGEIVKTPCEVCGDPKSEAHHPDYSRPLYVIWLCKPHHQRADEYRRMGEKIKRLEKLISLGVGA